jgi:polygalacturonase
LSQNPSMRRMCKIVPPCWVPAILLLSNLGFARADLPAPPPLPVFGSAVYNIAVANPSINSGQPANTGSADNAVAINAYITYCSTHGGGTVEIPSGTFLSGTLTMKSNVNLQLDGGSILRDTSINNKLITCSSGSNMQISGSGIIDGGATKTVGSTNLVDLRGVTTLAVLGVTIQNAGHEHLVPINDNNVTISGVTIADPGTLAANSGQYLANTDAIDFAGNNFLIKNCNISCGDDDIVAKPAGTACSNIVITGCTIGAGHGISVGGGSAQGLSNMVVTNCTMTGTDNGVRFKAADVPLSDGDAGGGTTHPVKNVIFNNIKMTNVGNPIVIDSFYDNGSNNFPSSPTDATHYPTAPAQLDATTPIWQNIAFENITATGSNNAGLLYGLNTAPSAMSGLSFSNVSISANTHMSLWYGDGIDLSGLKITVPGSDGFANASPIKGAFLSNLSNLALTPSLLPGDFDRNGQITLADIPAMLAALADLNGFESTRGITDAQLEVLGDFNSDFRVNNADIQSLLSLLISAAGSGATEAVPEPASLWLFAAGSLLLIRLRNSAGRTFGDLRERA